MKTMSNFPRYFAVHSDEYLPVYQALSGYRLAPKRKTVWRVRLVNGPRCLGFESVRTYPTQASAAKAAKRMTAND